MTQENLDTLIKQTNKGAAVSIIGILIIVVAYAVGFTQLYTLTQEVQQQNYVKDILKKDIDSLIKVKDIFERDMVAAIQGVDAPDSAVTQKSLNQADSIFNSNPLHHNQANNTVKIFLFGSNDAQLASLETLLEKENFTVAAKSKSDLATELNSVWYTPDVNYNDAKKVALLLIDARVKVVAIRPTRKMNKGKVIQIGSTSSFQYFKSLTKIEIENSAGPIIISNP
jgi:hypothetical protein